MKSFTNSYKNIGHDIEYKNGYYFLDGPLNRNAKVTLKSKEKNIT